MEPTLSNKTTDPVNPDCWLAQEHLWIVYTKNNKYTNNEYTSVVYVYIINSFF